MTRFSNQIALVTGAGSGIGREICLALGREGAVVMATDIADTSAAATAESIRQAGGRAESLRLDVTDAADFERIVADLFARHGRLDFLFNNAGIAVVSEAQNMTLDDWNRMLAVNIHGVVHGIAAVYGRMVKQRSGHIVNTASMAGLSPIPLMTGYATTKHAVIGLSTSLRCEAQTYGVRVSAVCPGFVRTAIFESATYHELRAADLLAMVPIPPITVEECVRDILDGVVRNKALIVTPTAARWLIRFLRPFPALLLWGGRKTAERVRALPK